MKSPHPAHGSGEPGILRRGSPASSTAQLPGGFPTCPQWLSLCHPGPTPRAPSIAQHWASKSHGSRTPCGPSVRPQHGLSDKTGRLERGGGLRAAGSASPIIHASEVSPASVETPNTDQIGIRFLFKKTSICFHCLLEHSLVWFPGE